ncbi:hypothetical protein [Granulicella sp. dw_53]|uniref:hypothetical protein n=1 Tax=Granulicella sp. dw_53 TaxID=2719792 RepID=UPI001BD36240|nr:hypothetical protein [Granulicella sp. dw_53]
MARQKPNPMHLTYWAIAGGAIAMSACFFSFLPFPHPHSDECGLWKNLWMNRSPIIAGPGLLMFGITLSFLAERHFNKRFRDGIWTDAELAPVVSLVSRSIWAWVTVATLVAYVLFVIVNHHFRGGTFFYILLFPLQFTARLRQLLTPKPIRDDALLGLQNLKSVQSEHWGERAVRIQTFPSQSS